MDFKWIGSGGFSGLVDCNVDDDDADEEDVSSSSTLSS